jgi:hypothetical protein
MSLNPANSLSVVCVRLLRYSQNWMFRYRIECESEIETERRAA